MNTSQFSYMSFAASFIVAYAALWVPKIKEGIGYKRAVPITQSFAIIALIVMATTQHYSEHSAAIYIAVGFYLLRQPLMNIAAPMTSDITMRCRRTKQGNDKWFDFCYLVGLHIFLVLFYLEFFVT